MNIVLSSVYTVLERSSNRVKLRDTRSQRIWVNMTWCQGNVRLCDGKWQRITIKQQQFVHRRAAAAAAVEEHRRRAYRCRVEMASTPGVMDDRLRCCVIHHRSCHLIQIWSPAAAVTATAESSRPGDLSIIAWSLGNHRRHNHSLVQLAPECRWFVKFWYEINLFTNKTLKTRSSFSISAVMLNAVDAIVLSKMCSVLTCLLLVTSDI